MPDRARNLGWQLQLLLILLPWVLRASPVLSLPGLAMVSVGGGHSCALDIGSGNVSCWGEGNDGQLGNGEQTSQKTPVSVLGLTKPIAVSAGGLHSCVVEELGEVKCWGSGNYGQLGHGGISARSSASLVSRLAPSIDVSAGGSHTCVLERSGLVQCWGWDAFGQVGCTGATGESQRYPVPVTGLDDCVAVSAGGLHSCAAMRNGTVWCWGWGEHGQLGNGSSPSHAEPSIVPGITDAVDVVCGHEHSCAKLSSGDITCWGQGVQLQLQNSYDVWEKTSRRSLPLYAAVELPWSLPLGLAW